MIFTTTYSKDDKSLLAQLQEIDKNKYLGFINEAAAKLDLQSCVIAGIGSRESHWGLILKPEGPEGTGDFAERKPRPPDRTGRLPDDGLGFGRGLMQIDYDWHEFARSGEWEDPRENILYGCRVLAQNLIISARKTPRAYNDRSILTVALAGYNTGINRAIRGLYEGDPDTYTFGKNYSADVLSRAGWFQLQGWT